ncbi:hypothetical protein JG688_00008487 [Phytophthora aleatoria]|uniref:Uncharacterized protein n=1 Tax=Phytophthora aleatoria TaxID=2496075 RepID=A0A8J5IR25_9STRA|nr:hypothetical protein JG688_00008487 [Phytophthora aleatoria]
MARTTSRSVSDRKLIKRRFFLSCVLPKITVWMPLAHHQILRRFLLIAVFS